MSTAPVKVKSTLPVLRTTTLELLAVGLTGHLWTGHGDAEVHLAGDVEADQAGGSGLDPEPSGDSGPGQSGDDRAYVVTGNCAFGNVQPEAGSNLAPWGDDDLSGVEPDPGPDFLHGLVGLGRRQTTALGRADVGCVQRQGERGVGVIVEDHEVVHARPRGQRVGEVVARQAGLAVEARLDPVDGRGRRLRRLLVGRTG